MTDFPLDYDNDFWLVGEGESSPGTCTPVFLSQSVYMLGFVVFFCFLGRQRFRFGEEGRCNSFMLINMLPVKFRLAALSLSICFYISMCNMYLALVIGDWK